MYNFVYVICKLPEIENMENAMYIVIVNTSLYKYSFTKVT